MKRALRWGVGLLVLLLVATTLLISRLRSGPGPATGERTLAVLDGEVEVLWDSVGIPRIRASTIADAVRAASVLVAMHPDQATDLVFETALALNKPFAVVPCCVFADANPHRVLANGAPVRTYDEMLEYYQAKAPDVRRARLAFEGRREVLYRLPPSCPMTEKKAQ